MHFVVRPHDHQSIRREVKARDLRAGVQDVHYQSGAPGLIYRLLDVIDEAIPWEGLSHNRVINTLRAWDLINKHREQRESADHDKPCH